MNWIDSHCHLSFDYAPKSADDLVQEARAQGVIKLINVCTKTEEIPGLQDVSARHADVYYTVGVHPHDTGEMKGEDLEALRKAAIRSRSSGAKCVAIGEVGLDYFYEHSSPQEQQRWLKQQLDLAIEVGLPVVIHSRDAEEDLARLLSDYAKQVASAKCPGVIHCFTGTLGFARRCIELGFYISLSGILTFKKAAELRATVAQLPLERVLVETDSPFLAPEPYRGKKCEPWMVTRTGHVLADILGVSVGELAQATWENTHRAFGI